MKLKKKAILFLEGMLSKEEEDNFRNNIKNEPEIQEFLHNYSGIEEGLHAYLQNKYSPGKKQPPKDDLDNSTHKDIQKYLIDYDKSYSEKEKNFLNKLRKISKGPQKKTGNFGIILNIAATIAFVALIVAGILHFINSKRLLKDNDVLFAENFQPLNDDYLKQVNSAFVVLDSGKLNLTEKGQTISEKSLNSVLRDGNMSQEDILLIAILLIQKGEFEIASEYLSDIIERSQEPLNHSARWYMSLIDIKEGKLVEASIILEILCQDYGQYGPRACQLLETLDKKNLN